MDALERYQKIKTQKRELGREKNREESKLTFIFRKGFDPTKVLQLTLRRGERGVTKVVNFKVRSLKNKVQLLQNIIYVLDREENNDPTVFQDSIANSPQNRLVMLTNLQDQRDIGSC